MKLTPRHATTFKIRQCHNLSILTSQNDQIKLEVFWVIYGVTIYLLRVSLNLFTYTNQFPETKTQRDLAHLSSPYQSL